MTKLPPHLERTRDENALKHHNAVLSPNYFEQFWLPGDDYKAGFNACYEKMKGLIEDVQKVLNRAIIYNVPPLNDRMVGAEIKTEITKILKKFRGA